MKRVERSIPTDVLTDELRKRREVLQAKRAELDRQIKAIPVRAHGAGRPNSPRCKCGKHTVEQAAKKGLPCK